MKLFLSALAGAMLILPGCLSASEPTLVITKFEGEKITGVEASSGFDVRLVKSDATKAVIEIDGKLEKFLKVSLGNDGVVSVGLDTQGGFKRFFNGDGRELDLTLYLPELYTVRLSGGADLETSDTFVSRGGRSLDVMVSGGADLEKLVYSGPSVKVQASGGADVSLTHDATNLYQGEEVPNPVMESTSTAMASGGSDVNIRTIGVSYTKLVASSGSDIDIKGYAGRGDWSASSGASIEGDEEFTIRDLNADASSAGSIDVIVTNNLKAKASSAGSVHYTGNPANVNVDTSSAGSVRKK